MSKQEKYPLSDVLKVLEGKTIYKSDKWWSAVIMLESFGRKQIAIYLWNNVSGQWKRRQKFMISNKHQWSQVKEAIENFVTQLP